MRASAGHGRIRVAVRSLVALALLSLSLAVVAGVSPAFAAPAISLTKTAPADVLVGSSIPYTLTVTNPSANAGAVPEYNVSFRDVLPIGVTYNGGSTSPATFGEPTVSTNAVTGQQTLVWQNVADVSPGSTASLSFTATADAAVLPVGTVVTNSSDAYAHTDPRTTPRFDANGVVVPGSYTQSDSDTAPTTMTALTVTKAEPSPEGELLRGIHDHPTVYTLTVRNNGTASSGGVQVQDFLPAGLEFLGCGGVDNSAGLEYPTAPPLTATPVIAPADCPTPTSVSTVTNPVGFPAGVYTRVLWTLGNLAANDVTTIKYAAGIPQRANTATWPGLTPLPGGLGQTANLDNNTGPSTRETATEQALTNQVQVTGDYTGPVVPGTDPHITATTSLTRSAEDLRMRKTASTNTFVQGGTVRYTLTVDASEYADGSNIVLQDHLPNGLCPLDNVANYVTGAPADCNPGGAFTPAGATLGNVVQNADGSFDITFTPVAVAANGTVTVSFTARMRTTYTGGALAGEPTSAADSFTNNATLAGTTVPPADVNAPAPAGPVQVADDSSHTMSAGGPQIQKSILPNVTPMDCNSPGYTHDPAPADIVFNEGSRICFRVRVDFPDNVSTRNPIVTDFLPAGTTYEAGSAVLTANNTVPATLAGTSPPFWNLGTPSAAGFFVAPGGVFEAQFSAIVDAPAPGPGPDLTANLMKFRYSLATGGTVSLRDSVDVTKAPAPPLGIVKGVADVNGTPSPENPPNTDHVLVKQGDLVRFRVDMTNLGTAANDNAVPILSPDVWDVLPAGITCADISGITDGGLCSDPGPGGPSYAGNDTQSLVRWQLGAAPALAPGASRTLHYAMTIPGDASVSQVYTNTASVASYHVATNLPGTTTTHQPKDNVDTGSDPADWDAPAASDASDVFLADVALTKSNVTDITEANNGLNDAVVGETLTYTISARVPPHTTVYNGVLTDPMPTGITYLSSTAGFSATNTAPATGALPAGVVLDPLTGTLTFPSTYQNPTNATQLFEVTVRARVSTLSSNTQGVLRTNTARFDSDTAPFGGTPVPARTAESTVTVVAPGATIVKSDNDANGIVTGTQQVTFTLRVQGQTGRPPTHDAWVVDCVPAGLIFNAFVNPHPGTATQTAGTGSNGCAAGTTRIAWDIPTVTEAAQQLQYSVTVSPDSVGGQTYTNTATLTGSSLDDGKADPLAPDNPLERTLTAVDTDTLTVAGGLIAKSADPGELTIGERGTWTIEGSISPNVNYFDAAVIDQLPAGIDPASVQIVSIVCTDAVLGPCTFPAPRTLTPVPGPGAGTTIGWGIGDIVASPDQRTATITYSAVVQNLAGIKRSDVLTNTARLRWNLVNGPDPTSAGATFTQGTTPASASVRVLEPVVTIDKNVSDTTPEPGQIFSYSIDATNLAGPDTSNAYNLTLVDAIPDGVVVDPTSIDLGGVLTGQGPNGGGTITWSIPGPLAPGATQSLTYDATLAPSATLTGAGLTNTADLNHYESLPTGGRTYSAPTDTATVTPVFPHASVAKSVSAGPAYIGEPKSFTITVTSDGVVTAHDIGSTDTLPPNWTYDLGSSRVVVAGGPATDVEPTVTTVGTVQTLSWPNLADLPVGKTATVTYTATPQADVVDDPGVGASVPHTNTAAITATDATGADHNANGDYVSDPATAKTHIDSADVKVDKTHTGSPVAGSTFNYQVVVSNAGPDTAVGPFHVVDTLPPGISSASATGTGWSCSSSLTQITCTRTNPANTLAAGASFAPITVAVGIPANTASGTTFTNGVTVADRTYDPNLTNNADTDTATSVRSVDLAIDKQLSGPMVAGQDATYTLAVTNNGPSDTTGPIVVTDPVPAGTTFVSAAGPTWACGQAAGLVTCTRAAGLTVGQSAPQITLRLSIPADRTDPVTNTAHVSGPSPDPVPANNDDSVTTTPTRAADLAIEKESTTDFVPGSNGTYRFTVNNFGPSYADAPVRITDTLPAELTYVSSTSVVGSWTCSAAGQVLTCDLAGRLPVGAHATVDVVVAIDSAHTGDIHNTAHVGSPTTDPNLGNNDDDDDTTSLVRTDLQILKSHTGPVVAGQNVTYTLAVRNNGPSDATGPITVVDTLPGVLTYVSATGTGWSCSAAGQVVTCVRAAGLTSATNAPDITLVASVAADGGPRVIVNHASVDGPDADTNPDNNTATDPTVISDVVNISVAKTNTGADPVSAGDTTTFSVVVHNDGPSDADKVSMTDELPAGLTMVSASGTGWTCNAVSPVVCTRPTLAAGQDAPAITVTVRVGAGVPGGTTITNTASVSTTSPGDDPADNTDNADVHVVAVADLQLTKSHTADAAVAGSPVTFDLDTQNLGPSDAVAPITVVDTLPAGLSYLSSAGPWTCAAAAQVVTCTLDGTDGVLAGTHAPLLQITVQVDAALDPGTLTNTATVSSPTTDPVPANNTDTDDLVVDTRANLSIVKTHTGSAHIGDPLVYTLAVHNDGPSEARSVTVTDHLPAGLTYVSATGTDWTCSAVLRVVTCDHTGPLAPDTDADPITLTVQVGPEAYPSVANTAVVDSSTPETDPTDNTSTDVVPVPPLVDLQITKTHVDPVQVGSSSTWTLEVVNNGPTADPGPLTVTDPLPTGLTFVSASATGWACDEAAGTVTCVSADGLAVGETSTITLTLAVEASAYPSVLNTASVTSPAEDTNPDNNTDSDTATVLPLVVLDLTKELVDQTTTRASYKLTVTNNGLNATVQATVVTDPLPPELTYVSSSGVGWTCTAAGQVVTCVHPDPIAAGASSSFTLVTAIDPNASGTFVNTAFVPGGGDGGTASAGGETLPPETIPNTGGPRFGLIPIGLLAVLVGTALIFGSRRRTVV